MDESPAAGHDGRLRQAARAVDVRGVRLPQGAGDAGRTVDDRPCPADQSIECGVVFQRPDDDLAAEVASVLGSASSLSKKGTHLESLDKQREHRLADSATGASQ